MAKTGSKLTSISDVELVKMALGGNQFAFTAIHAKYEKAVYGVVSKIVTHQEDIKDISLETFEKAFQKLDTFDMEKRFSTWLFTIARNSALDHKIKSENKGKVLVDTPTSVQGQDKPDNVPDEQPTPIDSIISAQNHEKFLACIEGLPELYAQVAEKYYIANLGYKEISEQLELPMGTVKTRINRAKALIINKMLEED